VAKKWKPCSEKKMQHVFGTSANQDYPHTNGIMINVPSIQSNDSLFNQNHRSCAKKRGKHGTEIADAMFRSWLFLPKVLLNVYRSALPHLLAGLSQEGDGTQHCANAPAAAQTTRWKKVEK